MSLPVKRKNVATDKLICRKEENQLQMEAFSKLNFVITRSDMKNYFKLLENPKIQKFLSEDVACVLADKYLLAMVFVYFRRAGLSGADVDELHFFVALCLAFDMEEENDDLREELIPRALGHDWQSLQRMFFDIRTQLWRKMDYRAVVSRRLCDEIMALSPEHFAWQRNRSPEDAGAVRRYSSAPGWSPFERWADGADSPECWIERLREDSAGSRPRSGPRKLVKRNQNKEDTMQFQGVPSLICEEE